MPDKNNLISQNDRPICSLLGVRESSNCATATKGSCSMTRLFKNVESDEFESANFVSQAKPGLLRLDSTGENEHWFMMPPQNQNRSQPGVQYITQTMHQQQHPNRLDRSPTPTRCGNNQLHARHSLPNNTRSRAVRINRGFLPGKSLMSNYVSGYRHSSPHYSPIQDSDRSQTGYPFHQFNAMAYPPAATLMPLGTSHIRAPMFGYAANVPYCSYYPPPHLVPHRPVNTPILYQAYPFMPGSDAFHHSQGMPHKPQNGTWSRPRERSRSKGRAKKKCKNTDVSNLAKSFQKVKVGQDEKSILGRKRTNSVNLDHEGNWCSDTEKAEIDDEITCRQPNVEVDLGPKQCEDCVESCNDENCKQGVRSGYDFVSAELSDEISVQSDKQCLANLNNSVSQVNDRQSANRVGHCDLVTRVASNAHSIEDRNIPSDGDNLDSGFSDSQITPSVQDEKCFDNETEELKLGDSPSKQLGSELADFEIVPEKFCSKSENESSPAAGSGATSDFVIFENDEQDGFISAYNMAIYETDVASDKPVSKDFARSFSVHVTELEHFNKDGHHCQKSDDAVQPVDGQDEPRSMSPVQGENSTSCNHGAKQKKKSRPSAKKRKRMKQKKGVINVSICDIAEKSTKEELDLDVCDKGSSATKVTNSPTRGCFRTVSFIVGSDSDTESDDFDVEFVKSPRNSPPKSCPKLQFKLLSSESDDEEASGSDSDFESDDNCPNNWTQDVLLDAFCIKDPYNPFSFQLQCTNIPVKKSVSSPKLSPPSAVAFDVTIKRSLDPDRRKVSFAVEDLTKIIEEEEALGPAFQEARKGPWEEVARDRHRFERRIADVECNIGYVFQPDHRKRIYDRFYVDSACT